MAAVHFVFLFSEVYFTLNWVAMRACLRARPGVVWVFADIYIIDIFFLTGLISQGARLQFASINSFSCQGLR